ncbi:MAG: PKD domain-containing protein [Marinoscillum sp.]
MKSFNFKHLLTLSLLAGFISLSSCGDGDQEDPIAAPEASFTTEVSGKTVVFTNTTVGEEVTYAWDFGDGNTSTTESPEHTYEANGSYIAKLTATNESGTDDSEGVLEIINITIDGELSDWDDVPALEFTGDGSFKEVKMENLGNQKLYVYVKGSGEASSFLDFWLNLDYSKTIAGENDTTGFFTGVYPGSNLGWDLLLEGFFGSADGRDLNISVDEGSGGMYILHMYPNDDDDNFSNNNAWGTWNQIALGSQINFTEMKTVDGDIAYEFSIDLQALPSSIIPDEGGTIQFFMDEWVNSPETTDGWCASFLGHYPTGQNEVDATAAAYTLK